MLTTVSAPPPMRKALAQYATRNGANNAMRAEALLQLGLWGKTPQRDRIVGIFGRWLRAMRKPAADALTAVLPKVLGKGPEAVQLAALEAIGNLQLREAAPTLVATVADDQAPEAVRVGALKALDTFGGDDVMRGIDAAEKSSAATLRLAALQIVARRCARTRAAHHQASVYRRFGGRAAGRVPGHGATQGRGHAQVAGRCARSARGRQGSARRAARADRVRRSERGAGGEGALGQAAGRMGRERQRAGALLVCARRWRSVSRRRASSTRTRCCRARAATRWVAKAAKRAPTSRSSARRRRRSTCSKSIIKPSAHIAAGFDVVTLTLKNGATETGSVASETPTEIVLKRADNTTTTIDPKQVKERVTAPSSMPEIYAQVLTRSQLRDIVAFLGVLTRAQRPDGEVPFGQSNRAMSSTAKETQAGGHP